MSVQVELSPEAISRTRLTVELIAARLGVDPVQVSGLKVERLLLIAAIADLCSKGYQDDGLYEELLGEEGFARMVDAIQEDVSR